MRHDAVPLVSMVDGVRVTSGFALDRGLHYGDGLFETLCCVQARVRFRTRHWARLAMGCERLGIRFDAWTALQEEVALLASQYARCIIKVIVTRGDAVSRGYRTDGRERARRYVLQYPWPEDLERASAEGARVRMAHIRLGENPALAGLKHLNRLEQVLAHAELDAADADEALLLGSSGQLVSGTMSNVFLVRDGHLQTPLLDRCGVAGVMRAVVMDRARRAGVPCDEISAGPEVLAAAEEIFLTNARIGIWPVHSLDGRELRVGGVTRHLLALVEPSLLTADDA